MEQLKEINIKMNYGEQIIEDFNLNLYVTSDSVKVKKLPEMIKRCTLFLLKSNSSNKHLKNWIIPNIIQAIIHYKDGYFHACRGSLILAFHYKISQEKAHLEKRSKLANKVSLKEAMKALPYFQVLHEKSLEAAHANQKHRL
jgi:hypothetical protein